MTADVVAICAYFLLVVLVFCLFARAVGWL